MAKHHPLSPHALDMIKRIVEALDGHKAEDVVVIPLAGKASFADALVVATGTSSRHVVSLADHVAEALKNAGHLTHHAEGRDSGEWVCLDAGDVVVHVFVPAARVLYNLEKLWSHNFDAAV